MQFFNKIFKSVEKEKEKEKEYLIQYFNSIAGTRIPNEDYSMIFNRISFREAKNLKIALDSYPDIILDELNIVDFESKLEAQRIREYRSNRPVIERKKIATSGFMAGVKAGYGPTSNGGSNH